MSDSFRLLVVRNLIGVLLLAGVVATCCLGQEEPAEQDAPEALFRRAFAEKCRPTDRIRLLERIAREHSDSKWADDALWALGEIARQHRLVRRVFYYWQFMMTRDETPELEEFTRTLALYRRSSLFRARYLLDAEGNSYIMIPQRSAKSQDGDSALRADGAGPQPVRYVCRPFNAVPMVVWAELGACYEQLSRPRLALDAYRKALDCAPRSGRWPAVYRKRVERLEELVAVLPPGKVDTAEAEASEAGSGACPPDTEGDGKPDASQSPPNDAPVASSSDKR